MARARSRQTDDSPAVAAGGLAQVEALARSALGAGGWRAEELRSSRTVRSFLLRKRGTAARLLRLAVEDEALVREVKAVEHLADAELFLDLEHHEEEGGRSSVPFVIYRGRGRLTAPRRRGIDIAEVAALLARLHDMPSLRLMRCFPFQEKPGILAVFQRIVENQRTYLLYRDQDGLPQDMLALTLADIGRAMRSFVVAHEHYFQPHPRRSLCHGGPTPAHLLRDRGDLRLYGFEAARVGDAARDLALFSLAAGLDEEQEASFLETYMEECARDDHRLIHRYFAHKVMAQFERPVDRLLGLYRIKYEGAPVFGDMVEVLIEEVEAATRELATALSSLNDFLGRGRPLAPRDVASMGRLVTYEEYLLREQPLTIAIDGAPYTGKTPVATELAARLDASYVNVGALLRTGVSLAGEEPSRVSAAAAARALTAHEVQLETASDAPHYAVQADGEEITGLIRTPALYEAQARLLAQPEARAQLSPAVSRFLGGVAVVEGERLDGLLPATARRFTLVSDEATRERRHQDHVDTAEAMVPPLRPAETPDGDPISTSDASFAQAALEIIQRCLPAELRDEILIPDFTGRRPLFEA